MGNWIFPAGHPLIMDFTYFFQTIGAQCAAPAVPESEVEAVIARKFFMVQVVMDGGIDPSTKRVVVHVSAEQFIPQVPVHIENQHQGNKCEERNGV